LPRTTIETLGRIGKTLEAELFFVLGNDPPGQCADGGIVLRAAASGHAEQHRKAGNKSRYFHIGQGLGERSIALMAKLIKLFKTSYKVKIFTLKSFMLP